MIQPIKDIYQILLDIKKNYDLSIILVYSNSMDNHMIDIIQKTSKLDISVDGIKSMYKTDAIVYEVTTYVRSLEQLNTLILNLSKESYITKVERVIR